MTPKRIHPKSPPHEAAPMVPGYRWIQSMTEADHIKPVLKESGVSVKLVALLFLQGLSAQKIACYFGLPLPAVREALAYAKIHADIDFGMRRSAHTSTAPNLHHRPMAGRKSFWPQWIPWISA